ncbi:MAG: biopolymer transporter ExbD [Gammaproteobacteria bacterium]|nr:biopolymer transporter ExbD [Gammaproteobacteria bacterium]
MRKRHTEHETPAAVVNLTPLLDMVFILLIFFLVTSSFLKETGIEVDRPAAGSALPQKSGGIVVTIDSRNEIWIERQPIAPQLLVSEIERLRRSNPGRGVVIAADKHSRTGLLIDVMDRLRLAGISNLTVATSEKHDPR